MALTPSAMVALASPAPDFALPDTEGNIVARDAFAGRPLLVMFICNHCPYVKHIADDLGPAAHRWMDAGVAVVAISSNDVANYPDDSPDAMVREKQDRGWPFSYLFDETQEVARSFNAQCTPDFFLFDAQHKLVYRGQMDDSRPSNGAPVTGASIDAAIEAMHAGTTLENQVPSIGCNIKWK